MFHPDRSSAGAPFNQRWDDAWRACVRRCRFDVRYQGKAASGDGRHSGADKLIEQMGRLLFFKEPLFV